MSNKILVGAISYLPDDPERRQKRLLAHNLQVDWIKNVLCKNVNYDLNFIYQKYKPEEVPKGLTDKDYELYDHGLHISPARNKILEKFYDVSNDYDICVILDDDMILYDYYDLSNFLPDLLASNNKDINIITTLYAKFTPFKSYNTKYKDVIQNKWILQESPPNAWGIYILYKNIKPYKLYFKDLDMTKGEGYEDIDFMLQIFRLNIRPYISYQLVTKVLLDEDSTWVKDKDTRLSDLRTINLQKLCDDYQDLGIKRTYKKDGSFMGFTHPVCYSSQPKILTFDRKIPYTTPENLIYKKKNDGSNTLF